MAAASSAYSCGRAGGPSFLFSIFVFLLLSPPTFLPPSSIEVCGEEASSSLLLHFSIPVATTPSLLPRLFLSPSLSLSLCPSPSPTFFFSTRCNAPKSDARGDRAAGTRGRPGWALRSPAPTAPAATIRRADGIAASAMDYEGPAVRIPGGARAAAVTEGSQSLGAQLDEDNMWQINMRANEATKPGPYPQRPGEPDCAYYIRTGLCRFGMTCRFNHPLDRLPAAAAAAAAGAKGGYPERIGQPECLYYLKTGTCKFGATCKFHHPRDKAGISGRVQLNILGYPLRPDEKECAYYLRTGQCKFGNTCKFHHPQPSNAVVSLRGSVYPPTVHSSTSLGQQSYPGGLTNWPLSRTSFISSPRWQGPSSYAQLILPQGLVQVPGWNAYPGQLGSVSSSESQQQITGTGQFYGTSRQNETTSAGVQGSSSPYRANTMPTGLYAFQRDNIFPERPGERECQYYMKTGDCKFGAVCRFHHPRERLIPVPNCMLSPLGLPLRPGEPQCLFYSRYGICKFGPNCKFDHPMGTLMYGISSGSSADVPAVRHLLGSSATASLPLSSEGSIET